MGSRVKWNEWHTFDIGNDFAAQAVWIPREISYAYTAGKANVLLFRYASITKYTLIGVRMYAHVVEAVG